MRIALNSQLIEREDVRIQDVQAHAHSSRVSRDSSTISNHWCTNPLPGDYNWDKSVNAADYSMWRDTLGSSIRVAADGTGLALDGVPDGIVDEHDYDFWKQNYGNGLAAEASFQLAVSERIVDDDTHGSEPQRSASRGLRDRYIDLIFAEFGARAARLRRGEGLIAAEMRFDAGRDVDRLLLLQDRIQTRRHDERIDDVTFEYESEPATKQQHVTDQSDKIDDSFEIMPLL